MYLKEYLNVNGIMRKWFAEKLGVSRTYLSGYLNEKIPMSSKYWTRILVISNGKVTLEDLMEKNEDYYDRIKHEKRAERHNSNNCELSHQAHPKQKQALDEPGKYPYSDLY